MMNQHRGTKQLRILLKMTQYRGFKGKINVKTNKSYRSHGVYRLVFLDLPFA